MSLLMLLGRVVVFQTKATAAGVRNVYIGHSQQWQANIRMLFLIQGPYVTWQTSLLPVLQFSPVSIVPPLLHTHIQFTYNLARSEMSLHRTPLSVTSGFQSADVSSASQFRVAIHADTQFRRIRTSKDKTSLIIREVRRGSFWRQCTSVVHKSSPCPLQKSFYTRICIRADLLLCTAQQNTQFAVRSLHHHTTLPAISDFVTCTTWIGLSHS
jgi:hypothetical protein